MRHGLFIRLAAVGAALALVRTAFALTVPVAQDSFSTTDGRLTTANGKASTLRIEAKRSALVRFDLSDLAVVPEAINPSNIQSAVLRVYVASASVAGPIAVTPVAANWQETFAGPPAPFPVIAPASPIMIPAADVIAKRFVSVDVTLYVIKALQDGDDFGFALQADGKTKVMIASKEGPGVGYAAELEIVANTAANGMGVLTNSAAEFGSLLANTATISGSLAGATGSFSGGLTVSSAFTIEPRPSNNPTIAGSNFFAGAGAGAANTTGDRNVSLGTNAGKSNVIGYSNVFVGYEAGSANTEGYSNSFLGAYAGRMNLAGLGNTFVGGGAGQLNEAGNFNVYVGTQAGFSSMGSENICIGVSTAGANNAASRGVIIGMQAGLLNTGDENCFIGWHAGFNNAAGIHNVFAGYRAGENNTASNNTFIGWQSGMTNQTGQQNTFYGVNSGRLTIGSLNTFLGSGAGENNAAGASNTGVGRRAGTNNTTGSGNTFVGRDAGLSNTGEDNNTFIGDSANGAVGVTNATAIGQGATVAVSNAVVLGKNCSVGIGTNAPNSTLQVNGSLSLPVRTSAQGTSLLLDSDYVLICTTSNPVVALPAATTGRIYVVKNRSATTLKIQPVVNTEKIDGAVSLTIAANATACVISDGTNWFNIN